MASSGLLDHSSSCLPRYSLLTLHPCVTHVSRQKRTVCEGNLSPCISRYGVRDPSGTPAATTRRHVHAMRLRTAAHAARARTRRLEANRCCRVTNVHHLPVPQRSAHVSAAKPGHLDAFDARIASWRRWPSSHVLHRQLVSNRLKSCQSRIPSFTCPFSVQPKNSTSDGLICNRTTARATTAPSRRIRGSEALPAF